MVTSLLIAFLTRGSIAEPSCSPFTSLVIIEPHRRLRTRFQTDSARPAGPRYIPRWILVDGDRHHHPARSRLRSSQGPVSDLRRKFVCVSAGSATRQLFGQHYWLAKCLSICSRSGRACLLLAVARTSLLETHGTTKLRTTIDVLKSPQFGVGLLAIMFVFCGRFASFTYLRPFLERTTHASPAWVSIVLLVFGLAYFAGNSFAPRMIQRDIHNALLKPPIFLALISVGFPTFRKLPLCDRDPGVSLGGRFRTRSAVVVNLGRQESSRACGNRRRSLRSCSSISAAIGALGGGLAFDFRGSTAVFLMCCLSWVISAFLVYRKVIRSPARNCQHGTTGHNYD